jgi:ABC-type transport system involved in multi-copper enzyme maturation permease subunit
MVALASKVPYMNLYIINIAQAIIAVFLASEFLKRDKKLDTTEVIYMRSMTNADYVIGKTIGNLWVFILLNIVALVMVLIFNISSPYTQFNILPYIYYFLLISVPTLVYILGLAFFLMSVLRNQAITFVLLLGYIAATLFYLQNKLHYLFDYMSFRLPVTWSEFVGFGNANELITHRGAYLFLGIGFICFTIILLKRLSQSKVSGAIVLFIGIASLLAGSIMGVSYLQNFSTIDSNRAEMLALNNKYADVPAVNMTKCDINLKHSGNKIICNTNIVIENRENRALNEVMFSLNPGLEVTKLVGGEYRREKQLLFIKPDSNVEPGGSASFSISYEGSIDESFCFLDIDSERRDEIIDSDNTTVDKRHAFILPDFVLLTSESRWYPVPGISYASKGLGWLKNTFTDFSLKVETDENLTVISQGEKTEEGSGVFSFTPETKLPKISLIIGNYETREISVDSVDYQLSFLRGHNFFDEYFTELPDSLDYVIRDIKSSWEAKLQLTYPFKRFGLIEVPVQFYSYEHAWTGAMDQVQPEMVLLPEGGFKVGGTNFALKKRFEKRRGPTNETTSILEKEERYFKEFVSQALTDEDKGRSFGGIRFGGGDFKDSEPNPYYIIYNYFTFANSINSEEYPIFNRVMEAYLIQASTVSGSGFMRNFLGISDEERGNIALQERTFAEILSEQDDPEILDNLIRTKSEFLFSLMKGAAGPEEFDVFLYDFIEKTRFREVGMDEMNNEMRNRFNLDLNDYLPDWYNSKSLPGYIFSEIDAVKVKKGDRIYTMVSLKITNTEENPGVVSVEFRLGGQGRRGRGPRRGGDEETVKRIVTVDSMQTKKVSILLNQDPRMMLINTLSSKNIPAVVSHRFDKIEQDDKVKPFDGEKVVAYDDGTLPNEIILDNEDEGFSIVEPEGGSFLKKMLEGMGKKEEDDLKYKGMNMWNPSAEWTLTTRAEFYGKQVRSAYYAKGGKGERKAVWNIPLKDAGYYKVFGFVPKISFRFGRGGGDKGEYTFKIFHDDGEDSPAVELKNTDGGWVELGSYYFSPDSVRIELSNNTESKMIYADAVKLVKVE